MNAATHQGFQRACRKTSRPKPMTAPAPPRPRISRLPLEAKDRVALQFESIMSLKISHLKIRRVLKAIMLLKINEMRDIKLLSYTKPW